MFNFFQLGIFSFLGDIKHVSDKFYRSRNESGAFEKVY